MFGYFVENWKLFKRLQSNVLMHAHCNHISDMLALALWHMRVDSRWAEVSRSHQMVPDLPNAVTDLSRYCDDPPTIQLFCSHSISNFATVMNYNEISDM